MCAGGVLLCAFCMPAAPTPPGSRPACCITPIDMRLTQMPETYACKTHLVKAPQALIAVGMPDDIAHAAVLDRTATHTLGLRSSRAATAAAHMTHM